MLEDDVYFPKFMEACELLGRVDALSFLDVG